MIKKIVAILIIIIAYVLQTTLFQVLELADVAPNILLIITVTYAYLRGRTSGILIGFICGLLLDAQFESVVGLYALALMTIGYLVGFCKKIYFRNSILLPIILIMGSDFIYGLYCYITGFMMRGRLNFGFCLMYRILPEMIYTTLVGCVIFMLLIKLENLLNRRKEA